MTTDATTIQDRRDLRGISADLKWSAVELSRIADRLDMAGNSVDADAVRRMIHVFQQDEARLMQIAEREAAPVG
ncbi:hypothetical protein EGJ27_00930 [Pseudomonas sp. v388]|uniref:hypothetical protein n=1 Tax=Pseudomonas sp. v388 TaxID=2479849 RepID=UPI000F77038B|nr:hypothetical protein [Pseudomonas sp. v388]RRV10803.1 hypothetical protein EGJ27_00930 [Pseudomonas sp. v388]